MTLELKIFIFIIIGLALIAACSSTALLNQEEEKVTILQLGDSWSWYTSQYGLLKEELKKDDLHITNKVVNLNQSGLTANLLNNDETWTARLNLALNRNKDLKVILLSIGGNDLIDRINVNDAEEFIQSELTKIILDISQIINKINSINQSIQIIYLGLDFPNLTESRTQSVLANINNSYWIKLGEPSPEQINSLLVSFLQRIIKLQESYSYFTVSNHLGYLQASSGIGVFPGQYPDYAPIHGGDLTLDTPSNFTQIQEGFVDSIHPNKKGYTHIINNVYHYYIKPVVK